MRDTPKMIIIKTAPPIITAETATTHTTAVTEAIQGHLAPDTQLNKATSDLDQKIGKATTETAKATKDTLNGAAPKNLNKVDKEGSSKVSIQGAVLERIRREATEATSYKVPHENHGLILFSW